MKLFALNASIELVRSSEKLNMRRHSSKTSKEFTTSASCDGNEENQKVSNSSQLDISLVQLSCQWSEIHQKHEHL